MRILEWNRWGICNASTVRALRALIRVQNPEILFLCETKASESRIKKVVSSIGFADHIAIGPKGRAGGICMIWANLLNVEVLEFNPNLVAITVRDSVCEWSLVGFYGPLYQAKRRKAWINLHGLLEALNGPWVVFGDFNVIVEDAEKDGGRCGASSTPSFLKELLFDLGAVDLGFTGNRYTWSNK
jgi:exonuclease III